MPAGKLRSKAFSHKVRTGCVTCKRRRVKCDELKPACGNCVRGRHKCLGYKVPESKIFPNEVSKGESIPEKSICGRPGWKCGVDLDHIILTPSFGDSKEIRSFQHWMRVTSPMLSHYGPDGGFFRVLVPQLAWQSLPIKHTLVALSTTHEKFLAAKGLDSLDRIAFATKQYNLAISHILNDMPSVVDVLVTSILAWCLEMMQNNFPAALTHLRAAIRFAKTYQWGGHPESNNEVSKYPIETCLRLAHGLTNIVLQKGTPELEIDPKYRGHIFSAWAGQEFTSYAEAREEGARILGGIVMASKGSGNCDELKSLKISLSYWLDGIRRWDQQAEPSANLKALVLLFNTIMAFLPATLAEGYSPDVNNAIISFIPDTVEEILNDKTVPAAEQEDLTKTLRVILSYSIRLPLDGKSWEKVLILFRRLRPADAAVPFREQRLL